MLARLIQQTRPVFYAAMVLSVLNGVANVGLVSLINEILNADGAARYPWLWGFAAIAVVALGLQVGTRILSERLTHGSQASIRSRVAEHASNARYQHLEKVGEARIRTALTDYCHDVAEFFVSLPVMLTNGIVVVGCMLYMLSLSWPIFLLACLTLLLGSAGYHLVHMRAIKHLHVAATEQERLFGHFDSLTAGAKELRLHRHKRELFSQQVLGNSIETVRRGKTTGMSVFALASGWGRFLIFAFIGLVLFLLAANNDQERVMTGIALLFLFMINPLEVLLLSIPRANMAKIAAGKIEAICDELKMEEASASVTPAGFHKIAMHGVIHRYFHEQSDEFFTLGPVNVSFRPGELVFLVGGNGSGKTTLAKLLIGLYVPEDGQIELDDKVVSHASRDEYRQLFSAIFSDFHLFERLLESPRSDLDEAGNRLLTKLHLQHKVQIKDGAFTTRALSQGQRKRLALVVAYLEDRPFLLFDEWAADQDPAFKDVFYRELLPELKAQGKTVVVISHDDRYFHLADRLLKMEDGQLREMALEADIAPAQVEPVMTRAEGAASVQ
ncbi:cyclic peptide export ABC transporter [Pokkaliibacter sp. MBI-7]|uniref:cyclic peptide export ABC transporter n=1 Tax=Pokkaliibacter sp. MBI-7 TaxID=3040600 RepID=UPI002449D182|nr:cyclic peptide export ABC transporter [Pokkaliibacter sp. MBI-7]MDH2433808.1 cyclic peptide export ABC transporter [Pokkaliibacter sp. MBI-7]